MTAVSPTTDSTNAAAYVAATFAILGDRDPLQVMGEQLGELERRVRGLSAAVRERPEAPGKWSVLQVVQHLADAELAFGWRFRQILTADQPVLQGYNENAWMTVLRADDADFDGALARLAALRADHLRLWRRCTPADLDRVGLHSERGPESLGFLRRLMAGHDLIHRRQLDRILAAAGA